ncbi:hypothetical protein [Pengzhenrongella sicca]|uniref:Cell division protein FtsL n=1 Tax=Pengzhenrongella sicca TaxID=2819238 RepID=A0A8A4ZI41_9MICO|nr:hypothetical protein [Pengzhenrongella sicca]QTE30653.1 hypothetical protein J4E96_06730 [Pengzhenrongella sicca]
MSPQPQPQSFAPAPRPAAAPGRTRAPAPRLRLVRAPQSTRTRAPFVIVCIAILVGALLGALVLNTTMARGSYEAHDLQIELATLARTEQGLSTQLLAHKAPGQLAASARALGMVPAPELAFLRLSDGAILGSPTPAGPAG